MNSKNITELKDNLSSCDICPRNCLTDRYVKADGICGMGAWLKIASYGPHYGEEPELVGNTASGTIFFSGCNLLCDFCQNFEISHYREGSYLSEEELASIMLKLQDAGCGNINLVTPTHYSPQILEALERAKSRGLSIPVVYNSSGYDKVETLEYFEGYIDIYMPDLKFADPKKSKRFANAPDYFEISSKAVIEMHRQVGDLEMENGVAARGLLIRHLVFPNGQSDTKRIIDFTASRLGPDTYLNLMDQYRPVFKAKEHEPIDCYAGQREFADNIAYAKSSGFTRPEYLYQ